MIVRNSIKAQPEKRIGRGESIKGYQETPEAIRCSINTLSYLIIGKNCVLNIDGKIELINKS